MMRTPSDMTMCLPVPNDAKPGFLERPNRVEMIDARELRHA